MTREEAIIIFCYIRAALESRLTLAEFMANELDQSRQRLSRQCSEKHRQWLTECAVETSSTEFVVEKCGGGDNAVQERGRR